MKVRVERSNNRILLGSDVPTPGLKYAIPGAYWRENSETWSLPLDLTTCYLLRDRFGNRLEIGPELTRWARAEKAKRATAENVAAAETADLVRLPEAAPALFAATAARPYQRAAIRFVADAVGRDGRRRALIGDTVGLGKTAEAIGAVLEIGAPGPYLVVCPMGAVEDVWAPELRRWLGADAEIVTLPTGRQKRDAILSDLPKRADGRIVMGHALDGLARTWVVVHPAVVRAQTLWICGAMETDEAGDRVLCGAGTKYKAGRVEQLDCGHEKDRTTKTIDRCEYPQLFDLEYGAVIADESDQILIRLTGTPNLQRRGMELLGERVRFDGARIAMSGTPFRSKAHQMWSTLNWLDPIRWSGKWRWIQSYWKTGGYSGYEIIKDGFMEEREHLMIADLKDVMIRRLREEVRGDLPPKIYPSNRPAETHVPGIYLPMSAGQRKAYDAIVKNGTAEIEGGSLNPLGILAEMTRMKQFAGAEGRLNSDGEFEPLAKGNKFDWFINFMKELGFPDRPASKLVVASQFTKILNAFAVGVSKEFRIRFGMITGDVTALKRSETIASFEDPDSDLSLLFINTKAGGSAITLDAADIMVILDETYVDDEQQQLEGRIDNRNPERKIAPRSYYYLRSEGSIEESIAQANAEARRMGRRVLDGSEIVKRRKEFTK